MSNIHVVNFKLESDEPWWICPSDCPCHLIYRGHTFDECSAYGPLDGPRHKKVECIYNGFCEIPRFSCDQCGISNTINKRDFRINYNGMTIIECYHCGTINQLFGGPNTKDIITLELPAYDDTIYKCIEVDSRCPDWTGVAVHICDESKSLHTHNKAINIDNLTGRPVLKVLECSNCHAVFEAWLHKHSLYKEFMRNIHNIKGELK